MLKFGSLETLGDPKSSSSCHITDTCRTWDYVHTFTQLTFPHFICRLWIVNVDTKTKAMLKFGSLLTVCVDRRSKKLLKRVHVESGIMYTLTHTQLSKTFSVHYETLDYECRH